MCAVCGRCVPLVVDHDHRTGIVRGLLCRITCNYRLLGRGLDNAELHSSAAAYLRDPPAVRSLGKEVVVPDVKGRRKATMPRMRRQRR